MADAYGVLTFKKSNECVLDVEYLVKALNTFRWENDNGMWETQNSDIGLCYSNQNAQYPTVYPIRIVSIIKKLPGTGEEIEIAAEDASEDDWDNLHYVKEDEFSLRTLTEVILPSIKSGWIEVACSAHEKQRYVLFEMLRICADGTATRRRLCSGPCVETLNEMESIDINNI